MGLANGTELRGSLPAMVTPFKDGAVDEATLRDLVEWHIAEGSHGLVPCGTTGESPTLSHDEHERVVEIVIDQAKGRVPGGEAVLQYRATTPSIHLRGGGGEGDRKPFRARVSWAEVVRLESDSNSVVDAFHGVARAYRPGIPG